MTLRYMNIHHTCGMDSMDSESEPSLVLMRKIIKIDIRTAHKSFFVVTVWKMDDCLISSPNTKKV